MNTQNTQTGTFYKNPG